MTPPPLFSYSLTSPTTPPTNPPLHATTLPSGRAVWAVNDSSVNLASVAQSPVTTPTSGSSGGVTPTSGGASSATAVGVTLVLLPSSLSPGATLAFTLTCTTTTNLFSSARVVININAPPTPGRFSVTPSSGIELATQFVMTALQWGDPDLPLSYAFGFQVIHTHTHTHTLMYMHTYTHTSPH